jgi:thiazole synthase
MKISNKLVIAGKEFSSRLMLGTGKYRTNEEMVAAIRESKAEIVTVAIRRMDLDKPQQKSILDFLDLKRIQLLPNTAGAKTVDEACRMARLARAAGLTDWIKLEVQPDPKYLLPDPVGTLEACRILVKEGFKVLPYTIDSPILAKQLEEAGAATIMPGASPIGSGKGIANLDNVKIILKQCGVPVVIDSGLGTASEAAMAMEIGVDAVLVNTAVAEAKDCALMAAAFRDATSAGRNAFLAGRMPIREYASASSSAVGMIE